MFHRCLDGNKIQIIEGLEHCTRLEELHVANQRLSCEVHLRFDPASLLSIAVIASLLFNDFPLMRRAVASVAFFQCR